MKKAITILLTILITSCSSIPDLIMVKDDEWKRDAKGDFILKTTKETNPYLGERFVIQKIDTVLNPLPRLKERAKIVYTHSHLGLLDMMIDTFNNEYEIIGASLTVNVNNIAGTKKDLLEEAAILMGADLLLVRKVGHKIGIMFISTK